MLLFYLLNPIVCALKAKRNKKLEKYAIVSNIRLNNL